MEGFLLFLVSVFSLGSIYVILCLALNLESGVGGLWDLGIVSFFGIGAYAYTLIIAPPALSYQHYVLGLELPTIFGLLLAIVAGGFTAYMIGLPSLKLKREYFLITTIAFSEVIRQIFSNENWLTNGVAGIYSLKQPLRGWFDAQTYSIVLLIIFFLITIICFIIVQKLTLSPYGRALKAIRENESLSSTAGINPQKFNQSVFIIAGCLSGLAGALYVWFNTLIVPHQFSPEITFFVWTAVIIGGIGNNKGAFIGGLVFVVLHDLLRFLQISPDLALVISSLKISIIGIVLVVILRFRSEGLIPERPIIINRDKRA